MANVVRAAIHLSIVSKLDAAQKLVAKVAKAWPVVPRLASLVKSLGTLLRSPEKRHEAFVFLVARCSAEISLQTADPPPVSAAHRKMLDTNVNGFTNTVAAFLKGPKKREEFHGPDYTWTGLMTKRLEQTPGVTVQRLSSKAARVRGRIAVTKSEAWAAACKAEADRATRAEEAKRKRVLLTELEALLPADVELPKAKRARVEPEAGPAGRAPVVHEVIDLTAD